MLVAALLGGLAALVAAFTPRRAYATAAIIIAVFIVPPIIVALVAEPGQPGLGRLLVAAQPRPTSSTGRTPGSSAASADDPIVAALDLPGVAYLAAALVGDRRGDRADVRRYATIQV